MNACNAGKSHLLHQIQWIVINMSDLSDMEEELRELQKIMTTKGHWIGQD